MSNKMGCTVVPGYHSQQHRSLAAPTLFFTSLTNYKQSTPSSGSAFSHIVYLPNLTAKLTAIPVIANEQKRSETRMNLY